MDALRGSGAAAAAVLVPAGRGGPTGTRGYPRPGEVLPRARFEPPEVPVGKAPGNGRPRRPPGAGPPIPEGLGFVFIKAYQVVLVLGI